MIFEVVGDNDHILTIDMSVRKRVLKALLTFQACIQVPTA